ncbi:MAG: MFS transporter [candidate division WOR-3 bacterium]|nr:MFS transporter [candidate division WOR-3 bacterium]MCX7757566.1 MFS transporter [candidate division WOR-3 bacterium]MDW7987542.1 MFS transporter [candidate division WOR-3 bacterium]
MSNNSVHTSNNELRTYTPSGSRSEFLSVLKIKNFMIFSLSQAVSLFGDKVDYMALLAMIAYFSDKLGWQNSRALSYLSIIITLPTIALGPLAGVFIDRWNRLKVLIFCDLSRAILVSIIPLVILNTTSLTLVYVITFLVFLFGLFFNTARMSIIPNLVARRRLLSANAFINFIGRVATFLGVLIGGLVVDWQIWHKIGIKYSWAAGFYLDGLSYIISVFALVFIWTKTSFSNKISQSIKEPSTATPDAQIINVAQSAIKKFLGEIDFAVKFVKSNLLVLFVFITIIVLVLLGAGTFILLVPYIQAPTIKMGLGWGTKGVSLVIATGALGLVLSSIGYGIIGHRINKYTLLPISLIIIAAIIVMIPFISKFWLVAFLAFVVGLLVSPIFIAQDTILQEIVPSEIRGRIFSGREWILHVSFAVSALLIGEFSNFLSRKTLLFIIGAIALIFNTILLLFIKRTSKAKLA